MKIGMGLCAMLLVLGLSSCVTGPRAPQGREAKNPYQKDFLALAEYIQENHAGFYEAPLQTMSLSEYRELVARTAQRLEAVSDLPGFYYEVCPFVAALRDGHTRLASAAGRSLGLGAWWFKDKLVICSVEDPAAADLLYSEITAISQRPMADIQKLADRYIPADMGQDEAKKLYSPDLILSNFFLLHEGLMNEKEEVELTVAKGDGEKHITLKGRYKSAMSAYAIPARFRNAVTAVKRDNVYALVPDSRTLYVQLNSLARPDYAPFWHEVFAFAQGQGADSLVLDLRNNSGGNSIWCNEFLSYLVDGPRDLLVYEGWRSDYPHGNVKVSNGVWHILPNKDKLHFPGKVIVLASRATFSSATFFVVAVKDNDLGIVVGSPVGNGSIRYGFMADPITLPYTKIQFSTTHYVWARANKDMLSKEGASIEPSIPVQETVEDLKAGRDPVFDRAMGLLGGWKSGAELEEKNP
jgi:hypothetical protein